MLGHSGLRVSRLSLGTWPAFGRILSQSKANAMVAEAYRLGINLFDTANVYADGAAESALGRAFRNLPRSRFAIITKCFFPVSEYALDRGLSRKHIVDSVEASLRRLMVDYIDLHLCHRFDRETPLEETIRTYDDLIARGKILYWGTSDWTMGNIKDAMKVCNEFGYAKPIANQIQHSVMKQFLTAPELVKLHSLGVAPMAYSPLAQGVLAGNYLKKTTDKQRRSTITKDDNLTRFLQLDMANKVQEFASYAASLECSPTRVALAYNLSKAELATHVLGARTTTQLKECVSSLQLKLEQRQIKHIDRIFSSSRTD